MISLLSISEASTRWTLAPKRLTSAVAALPNFVQSITGRIQVAPVLIGVESGTDGNYFLNYSIEASNCLLDRGVSGNLTLIIIGAVLIVVDHFKSSTCKSINSLSTTLQFYWSIMGHFTWQPLLGLLSWYPVMLSSLCNSFDDRAPVDEIYGCPIFKWVAVAWLENRTRG